MSNVTNHTGNVTHVLGGPGFPAELFIDPTIIPDTFMGFIQVCFLGAVYGWILKNGAEMISDGSELLLLIPKWAPLIGSVVLPVLGAVPDGAVVLFSGLGPNAQHEVSVGVGALAGSTIMLLTVPWFLAQFAGRVNLGADGQPNYTKPADAPRGWKKLAPEDKIVDTGVAMSESVVTASRFMLVTLVPYLTVQLPALFDSCAQSDEDKECKTPRTATLIAGILTIILFFAYLFEQIRKQHENEVVEGKQEEMRKKAVSNGLISLRGVFADKIQAAMAMTSAEDTPLSPVSPKDKKFRSFLKPFFHKYDKDGSGTIDRVELGLLLQSLGEKPSADRVKELMDEMDKDKSGSIDFDEFCAAMASVLANNDNMQGAANNAAVAAVRGEDDKQPVEQMDGAEDDDEEEDEEEVPEDLAHLPPEQQKAAIIKRAFTTMLIGTLIVVLFSDPMVGVLGAVGTRTGIPSFYVSFVLAPIVSNGAELLAAYTYALKKTPKSMNISLATLVGSSIMNNTFCLAIFLFLVYFRHLRWIFTAEITAIVAVEVCMFALILVCSRKQMIHTWMAFGVIALFPASIALVALLEFIGLN